VGLSDLVRTYGVGPAFARILYDTGIHSISEFRSYSPHQVIDLYEKEAGKKADFSTDDIKFSLDLVQILDIE
jgi:nucleotidyltransferase/DNA polymerase involved in DNA repair